MRHHFEIVVGHPYDLLKDGERIFQGTWADCKNEMLRQAQDDDVVSPGPAMQRLPAKQYRQRHK